MKNLKFAGLVASLAVLGGCSTTQMNDNDPGIMDRPAEMAMPDLPPVNHVPDGIPDWYINLPEDTSEKIFGSGSGLSSDLQFSMDKAMHQAKIILGDKLNTKVSAEIKTYMADNSSIGNGITVEETQRVSKSGFKDIDVSSYSVIHKSVYREDEKFRSYILLGLDVGGDKREERIVQDNVTTPVDIQAIQKAQDNARESMNSL